MALEIDASVVKWSDDGSLAGRALLLLLHGYGQREGSLDAIADAVAPEIVTAQLRGPRESREPLPGGYGWTDVDADIVPLPGQPEETAAALLRWLDAVVAERGAPSSIGLTGFSQGAAFCLALLRTAPERWAAVGTLAGYWTPGVFAGEARLGQLRPPVFWGRSEHDFAIRPEYVDTTRAALAPFAPDAEHVYPGDTHQVLPEMVEDLAPFLRAHLT